MFRSLLVPLDGSTAAEQALPWAVSLARRFGAALKIIHVHVPIWDVSGENSVYSLLADREIREEMQVYLDDIVRRISDNMGIFPTSALLEGSVADAIERHATELGVDLVVMTTQGRGTVARMLLGSVADRLVRQSKVPLLLVRPHDEEEEVDLTQDPKFERILIPLDGSQLAEQILGPATILAAATNAQVTLFFVSRQIVQGQGVAKRRGLSGLRPELLAQLHEVDLQKQAQGKEYLAQLVERLKEKLLSVETQIASHVQPAAAILNEAATLGVDLIALATHGRGGLKRLLVGSVADKVLRGATMPVLVYRPIGPTDSTVEEKEE